MSEYIALAPTAANIASGELEFPLQYAGGNSPPVNITTSGPDEVGYVYHQDEPSENWTIPHQLGRYPSVTVQSSEAAAGLVEIQVIVRHESLNQLTLRFMEPAEGLAWLR